MVDMARRKKWNYTDTSSTQFDNYMNKVKESHQSGAYSASYMSPSDAVKLAQQAKLQQMQQIDMYQTQQYQQYQLVPEYLVRDIPPTPNGFLGVPQYPRHSRGVPIL